MSYYQDTSGTSACQYGTFTYPYQWTSRKHCGGITKCGKVCHKGINIIVLKNDNGKIKAYCRECDEFIQEGEFTNECHD